MSATEGRGREICRKSGENVREWIPYIFILSYLKEK